jgi:choline dehydrogenase-like flavoprotein
VISGRRINTGIAFLGDDVRTRPNLTITPHAEVDSVLFDGSRAVGVADAAGMTYPCPAGHPVRRCLWQPGDPHAFGHRSRRAPTRPGHTGARRPAVGTNLQEHPFYYNVYALKPAADSMHPAAGAILWAASSEAEPGDLDLHVSATHLSDPAQSPTGGAIVLAVAVTQPESTGRVRLADRDPRSAPYAMHACQPGSTVASQQPKSPNGQGTASRSCSVSMRNASKAKTTSPSAGSLKPSPRTDN